MKTPKPLTFAEALRHALDQAGETPYRLAQLTGIAHASVSRFLSGDQLPGWVAACKIALALGITLDSLRTEDIQLPPPPPVGSRGRPKSISKKTNDIS